MNYTRLNDYKNWLKQNLSAERYEHTLGVAECAKELARQFNLDEDKAELAGLIHDCAKCIDSNQLRTMINNLPDLCDGELVNHKTYHAPAGVIVAKKEFGIEDEEILSSIRWHTIGKINMTDFEKVIFIAERLLSECGIFFTHFDYYLFTFLNEYNKLIKYRDLKQIKGAELAKLSFLSTGKIFDF